MDSKRNGSGPPPPPPRSGSFQWDEPPSRGKKPDFQFTDDDDQAAPEEDAELLEEEDAEPDFVDSALIEEVNPAHGGPPPIPAPMPRAHDRGAFLDDGEIALPPGLSQVVRTQSGSSFPFREIADDDDDPRGPATDDDVMRAGDFGADMPPDGDEDDFGSTLSEAPVPKASKPALAEDDFGSTLSEAPVPKASKSARPEDDFADLNETSRLIPARAARPEDDFADLNEASRLIPAPPAARVAPPEDDFADLGEPSRALTTPVDDDLEAFDEQPATHLDSDFGDHRTPPPPPARRLDDAFDLPARPTRPSLDGEFGEPARADDDDDLGNLGGPARADDGLRDSQSLVPPGAVSDALDASGFAPASDADLSDDAPLPPPPPAALDYDGDPLPPLIAASAAQSGVGFSRAELERSYERLPIVRVPQTAEPTRPFSEIHGPKDSSDEHPQAGARARTGSDPLADHSDDEPTPGLAAMPSEPLGEPFPLDLWSDPDELIGRDLGRYRLVKPLSRGLTTRVYAAIDEESGRHVAIRILGPTCSPAEPRARQFLYEAQQLARLRHESIVDVIDTGTTTDHLSYYVMERVEGDPLSTVLRAEGPLPWQQVGIITTQICEALIVAADKDLHAIDFNLASVLRLRGEGEDGRGRQPITLLGIGVSPVASLYRSPDGNLVESKGTPPGTAEYMAPEVASGGFPEPSSVVYAIGVMMYELLTGRPPFRGDSFLAVIKKQMYDDPTPPSAVVPQQEIAGPFEAVVLQALAKDPSLRFPSVRALHEAVLAARAQEGELRRATAILSLDPTFWDERSSRKSEPHAAPPPQPEPQPLATFTSDLRQKNPALAEAVLGPTPAARSEPVPVPRADAPSEPRAIPIPPALQTPPPPSKPSRPEPSMILSQLAPPLRAPEPVAQPAPAPAAPMPLIVVAPPPTATGNFIRNLSLGIVAGSALIFLVLWLSRGPATPPPRKPDTVAEGSSKRARDAAKSRRAARDARDARERDNEAEPIVVAAPPEPETKPEPTPPVPEAKLVPTPPVPETKVAPTLVPETKPLPVPVPETKPEPVPVPETKPEPKPAPETKTEAPKPKPKPKSSVDTSLPARIEPIRLKSRYSSMESRIAARCAGMSGLGTASGLKVNVKIVVDTQGIVKATAQGTWTGTPLGRCVEDFVESIRFNETQHGGSRLHTFTF